MTCEDFPCCGHEAGCCPDFDEAGNQLNMKCTCGATVPLTSRSSLCHNCLTAPDEYGEYSGLDLRDFEDEPEPDDDDDDSETD